MLLDAEPFLEASVRCCSAPRAPFGCKITTPARHRIAAPPWRRTGVASGRREAITGCQRGSTPDPAQKAPECACCDPQYLVGNDSSRHTRSEPPSRAQARPAWAEARL